MNHFNYHHLLYFRVIATEGSISKAAQKLSLGQPTLSMQLKQFEDSLGHALFERKNRSLQLTEMGRLVLSYANEIFRLGEEMADAIHDRPSTRKIRLQIGVLESVPKSLVRALMAKAYQLGDCQISIYEGEGKELVDGLLEHRLDLVLSNASGGNLTAEKIYSKSISRMPLVVMGNKRYEKLSKDFPKSLHGQPFILPTVNSPTRQEIEYFFENNKITPNIIAEMMDTTLMKSLAVEGLGLIVISGPAVRMSFVNEDLSVVGELKGAFEEIFLLSAQRKLQNPLANILMKEFEFKF